jgi:hypothetical protein
MPRFQSRVKRTRGGGYQLRLPREERELLRTLPGQLREVLGSDDPALARLSPPAYEDDPVRSREFAELVGDDLAASRRRSLDLMEATIDAERLDEEQLTAWLGALNDLRLVLGTRLDVTEEMYERPPATDDPNAHAFAVFVYLGWLQEQVVAALAGDLDPRGTEG